MKLSVTYCLSYQQDVKLLLLPADNLENKAEALKASAADGLGSFTYNSEHYSCVVLQHCVIYSTLCYAFLYF